ncbi:MAG: hypothetical protein U5J82_06515 [Desulfobacterales bacterium]|nr:hypothetical protein [Desulfobacterales bacterium]
MEPARSDHIASRLAKENKDVVGVDRHADAIRRVTRKPGCSGLEGSGASPRVLQEGGVNRPTWSAVTYSDEP